MNFFEHQTRARRSTRWLIALFALAVLGIALTVSLLVAVAIAGEGTGLARAFGAVFVPCTVAVLLLVGTATLFKTARLRSGGRAVAESMGATPVAPDARDFQLRRLHNVVEEMAIASGVPVPAVYVMENEPGINAFAAGWTPSDAAVAVTRGALDQLRRDELQGVIAHEFSHVVNGDMRLNIRLMGVLFGILVLAIVGEKILRYGPRGGSRRDGGGQIALIGIGLLAIGWIGVFFGRMIKAAVSRAREYLADASAVQFTRDPHGIAGALLKIAGLSGSKLASARKEDVSHMLFADGIGARLLTTHPPIEQRIRRIDPSLRLERKALAASLRPDEGKLEDAAAAVSAFSATAATVPAASVTGAVGTIGVDHVQIAREQRAAISDALLTAAHDPVQAPAILFALLLSRDARTAAAQRRTLAGWPECERSVERLESQVAALPPLSRLPLAMMALPALRDRAEPELQRLRESVHALIHADERVEVFEYALGAMLEAQLGDLIRPSRRAVDPRLRLDAVKAQAQLLLAVLAHVGAQTPADAAKAFQRGYDRLFPREAARYAEPRRWHEALDAAVARLDRLAPLSKQLVIEACVATIEHDGVVSADEYELLRAICAALHCPLPPLAATPQRSA